MPEIFHGCEARMYVKSVAHGISWIFGHNIDASNRWMIDNRQRMILGCSMKDLFCRCQGIKVGSLRLGSHIGCSAIPFTAD